MSRAPRIPKSVKYEVYEEARKNKSEPVDSVAGRLEKRIEDMGERVPARETLKNMISQARNDDDPEDASWELSSLTKYPIPPEALPSVLRVWDYTHGATWNAPIPFTVRVAKWAARLYKLYDDQIGGLTLQAFRMANMERFDELASAGREAREERRKMGSDGMALLTWDEEQAQQKILDLFYHTVGDLRAKTPERRERVLWVERMWKTPIPKERSPGGEGIQENTQKGVRHERQHTTKGEE